MSPRDRKAELARRLEENHQRHSSARQEIGFDAGRRHLMLPVDAIDPNPFQPRKVFDEDELRQLAGSIAELGQHQLHEMIVLCLIHRGRHPVLHGLRRRRLQRRHGRYGPIDLGCPGGSCRLSAPSPRDSTPSCRDPDRGTAASPLLHNRGR